MALMDVAVGLHHAARHGHEQREAQVSRRLRDHAGSVGNQDAAARASRHINVVVTDAHGGDHAQVRRLLHHFRADRRAGSQQTLDLPASFRQLRGGQAHVLRVDSNLALRRDSIDCRALQRARDENFRSAQESLPNRFETGLIP